jgi:NAD(P) transhydrogenase
MRAACQTVHDSQMVESYDYVVIGGGPAGEKGAVAAAYFGKKVCVIEREAYLGGACVNTGTIPSKTLRETCLHLSGFKQRGIAAATPSGIKDLTVEQLMSRAHHVMDVERGRALDTLERHGVTLLRGSAGFVGPHDIQIDGPEGARRIQAEKVLIATGSSPHRPAGIDFSHELIDDSDEFLRIERVPRSLIVMGGGVIGCEYATMFATLGARVALTDGRPMLLAFLDREIADRLRTYMVDGLRIDLHLGKTVEGVEALEDRVICRLSSGDVIEAERLLVAAGRQGNTKGLGLEIVGVATDKRGNICVSECYQTSAPHVYAVGDVIGFPALASVSMEQARVATTHAFDLGSRSRVDSLLPYGIYTIPEVSCIGESEESAKEKGIAVETGRASYGRNARGQIIGDTLGLVKLVFRREDRVLVGAHVVGEQAAELIHIAAAALHASATIDLFIEMVFNFPTLSETFKYAAYDGLGRLAGRPGPTSVTAIGSG